MRRPALAAVWIIVVLWVAALSPSHADQPAPFPSPGQSATPLPQPGQPTPTSEAPESNPFPSPSPTEHEPAANGYVAGGYIGGNGSGGEIQPTPGATTTPTSFPSSGAGGFWIDLLGRLGPSYLAQLLYDNVNIHGGDNPLVSYAQGRFEYEPHHSLAAFGLGYVSAQRSTATVNLNGFGLGFSLLPDLRTGLSPYASVYVYPNLHSGGVSSTFTSADAGVLLAPRTGGGFFVRVGGSLRAGLPSSTSPTTITGVQLGLGTSF